MSAAGRTMHYSDFIALFFSSGALLSDLLSEKIPNVLTASAAASSLLLHLFTEGMSGVISFLGGAAVPFLLLYPAFRLRLIGAGDIKLLMAIGSLSGPYFALRLLFRSLLAGAALAAVLLLIRAVKSRRSGHTASDRPDPPESAPSENAAARRRLSNIRAAGKLQVHFAVPVFAAVLTFCIQNMYLLPR